MNIVEAIKSGKRFRRKNWLSHGIFTGTDWLQPSNHHCLRREDMKADDWEIEEAPVTITREQLLDAYLAAGKSDDVKHGRIDLINAIAKELGL